MNIFHKIALQGLKKNRTRTLVTIIGVLLSSVMITGVTTFGASLLDYMTRGAIQKYGDWNVAFFGVNQSFLQERLQDDETVDTVSFDNIGYALSEETDNPEKPYLFLAGFTQETFDALPVTLMSGRLPENSREVIISAKAVSEDGISYGAGDTITVSVGTRLKNGKELTQAEPYSADEEIFVPREEKTYTVVGTTRTPVFETADSPGYTLITRSDTSGSTANMSLFVTLKNPRQVFSYAKHFSNGCAYILNYDLLRIMGISDQPSDKVFLAFLYSFGGIVMAIIMVGSIFLIYNSFHISLSERIREIGILASVGATSKQLRNSVLFEGFCIGIIGIPIGTFMGLALIRFVLSVVSANFASILYAGVPLTIKLSAPAIVCAVAGSFATILISAWLPAKKAVRIPVMECIRQTNEIKTDARTMKISERKQRLCGLEGVLALKNFKRNRKRYRSIVLSLILSIVLFVSTNALIGSLQQTADEFRIVSDYDIGFSIQNMDDYNLLRLYNKLKSVSYIRSSSCRSAVRYSCTVSASQLSDAYWQAVGERSPEETVTIPMEIHFFNDEFYQNLVQKLGLSREEYTGENEKFIAVAKINDESNEVKGPADCPNVFQATSVDAAITLRTTAGPDAAPQQNINLTMLEFIPPDIPPMIDASEKSLPPYTFEILAPWSLKERLAPSALPIDEKIKGLCFDSEKPAQSIKEMREILTDEGINSSYLLVNCMEAYEQSKNYIFIANVFAYVFITLISLIAVANVFNTISTNIRLRRRELAMLRSVGMSDREFNKMMRFECALYGTKALAAGIPLSLIVSALIVKTTMTDETSFTLPWGSVGISALSVFLIIFVTMMYAVNKIKKENIIDALRDEMT